MGLRMGEVIHINFRPIEEEEEFQYETAEGFLLGLFEFLEDEDIDIITNYLDRPSSESYSELDDELKSFVNEYFDLLFREY